MIFLWTEPMWQNRRIGQTRLHAGVFRRYPVAETRPSRLVEAATHTGQDAQHHYG